MTVTTTRRYQRCVVIGTGLIGASLAGAGKARGLFAHVVGVGRSMSNLEIARERGLIDEARTDLFPALADADLIVIATPVFTAVSQLHELAHHAPQTAVLTDVGSVKTPIVVEAGKRGLASRFLGAHPLAGKAETGAVAADAELFRGRRVVLTPVDETPEALVEDMRGLWTALDAEVSVMDADDHDSVLAWSSHLPQMVAYALAAAAEGADAREDIAKLIAGGFRDTTRLAASDADMWVDILRLNAEAIVDAMDEFSVVWDDLRDAIADHDDRAIRSVISASNKFRKEIVPS